MNPIDFEVTVKDIPPCSKTLSAEHGLNFAALYHQ
jgi:hypothetical protein